MKDLLVVGGGPSGLATAVYAARAGFDVSVWERHAGVLDKACGEGLMPGAVSTRDLNAVNRFAFAVRSFSIFERSSLSLSPSASRTESITSVTEFS